MICPSDDYCQKCQELGDLYEYERDRHERTMKDLQQYARALRAVYALVTLNKSSVSILNQIEEAALSALQGWEQEAAIREYLRDVR